MHARGGVDGDARHGLGPRGGDLLDVHAPFRGGDGDEAAAGAVEDVGDVELPLDGAGFGEHDGADRVSLDVHAEDVPGRLLGLGRVGGEAYSARLAAPAGLHLRLDDGASAERAGDLPGPLGRVGDLGPRYDDAVFCEEFPCLVFVQVHLGS